MTSAVDMSTSSAVASPRPQPSPSKVHPWVSPLSTRADEDDPELGPMTKYVRLMHEIAPKPRFVQYREDHADRYVEYVVLSGKSMQPHHRNHFHFIGRDFVFDNYRIFMRFFRHVNVKSMSGAVVFNRDCEGPPGRAHGGAIAAAFDQLLSIVGWSHGFHGFTGQLSISYRRGIPLLQHLYYIANITSVVGKKVAIEMKFVLVETAETKAQMNIEGNERGLVVVDGSGERGLVAAESSGIWSHQPLIPDMFPSAL